MENKQDIENYLSVELGEAAGFLEVVYREICSTYSETIVQLQMEQVSDSEKLLRTFAGFSEGDFKCYLNAEAPVLRKSKDRSNKLREKGNQAYGKKNNAEAIKLYTDAIRFAPYTILAEDFPTGTGEELSLACANRSAVLVQQEEYRNALSDIDFALRANYPKKLRYKLLERRGKCYLALKKNKLALRAFNDCLEAVGESGLEGEKRTLVESQLNSLVPSQEGLVPSQEGIEEEREEDLEEKETDFPTLKEKNKRFPAFSSAVSIQFSEDRGRYGVASRDIPLGELLCIEDPPCFYLHEETTGLNCSNCFRRSAAPLPSPLCTQNVFCSFECQKSGMESYHVVESKFMDVLFQNGLKKKEWFLALRAVTQKPLEFFTSIKHKLEHNPLMGTDKEKGEEDIYNTDDFFSLYNLVSHHSQWEFQEHAYKAFFALFFIRCLQKSQYFGAEQSRDNTLGENELLIGRILIHLMEVATMNSHEIGQLETSDNRSWLLGSTKPVGCAVEPTLVLLNHSCDPTLIRVNDGTRTLCFASRHLKKGDEITDSYTFAYDVLAKIERTGSLNRKYKFTCKCTACKQDWSTFHGLPKSFNDLAEDQLILSTQDAPYLQKRVYEIQQLGAKIHKLQQAQDYTAAMTVYPDFTRTLEFVIKPPHQFYVIARRSYATCLWVKYGSLVNL